MNNPTLCVITPTIGRPTLRRTLESGELGEADLWLIVYDYCNDFEDRALTELIAYQGISLQSYHEMFNVGSTQNAYGNHARDIAMDWCQRGMFQRDYFIFLDDDDVFAPGAVQIIKQAIAKHNPRPIIFRMVNGNGETLWHNREVTPGNVGGSMFCCPNVPGKLGKWDNGAGHRSDYEFIRGTLESYGDGWRQQIVWSDEVIIQCRPEEK